jgi:hypothetical protein
VAAIAVEAGSSGTRDVHLTNTLVAGNKAKIAGGGISTDFSTAGGSLNITNGTLTVTAHWIVRHGPALLTQSFAVSLPVGDTNRSTAKAGPEAPKEQKPGHHHLESSTGGRGHQR